MKSVFLTGASGVGKSTTFRRLVDRDYVPSPNHLTRAPRPHEVEGFDAHFISVAQFAANMAIHTYVEESMDEAAYGGTYYGSPRSWEQQARENRDPFVAIPANALALRSLLLHLEKDGMRDRVLWVNLHAPLQTRAERVSRYIHDPALLHTRLHSGVGQGTKPDANVNIDTSLYSKDEVVTQVIQLAKIS